MKVMAGGQTIMIQCKRKYSIDELYEIMRIGNIEEKFGAIELKKGFIEKNITVPGLKGFSNVVQTASKTIQISQIKKEGLLSGLVNHVTAGALTNVKSIGLAAGFGGAKDNKEVMKVLAEEIEKLVDAK